MLLRAHSQTEKKQPDKNEYFVSVYGIVVVQFGCHRVQFFEGFLEDFQHLVKLSVVGHRRVV